MSISPLEVFSYFVEWLVVAQLLENVLGVERTHRLFPLLLLVLPAKLLVAGRIVTWSELAGAVLTCICWYFLSGYSKRTTVVGGLIVGIMACAETDRCAAYSQATAAHAMRFPTNPQKDVGQIWT